MNWNHLIAAYTACELLIDRLAEVNDEGHAALMGALRHLRRGW